MKIVHVILVVSVLCLTAYSQKPAENTSSEESISPAKTATEKKKKEPATATKSTQETPNETGTDTKKPGKSSTGPGPKDTEKNTETAKEEADTPADQPSTPVPEADTDDADFDNPFATGDEEETVSPEPQEETADTPENPFLAGPQTDVDTEEDAFEEASDGLDFLVDLAIGVNLPRFEVEPNSITSEGTPNFLFNAGVIIPFAKWFYGGVSLRYLQHAFKLGKFDTSYTDSTASFTSFDTREKMTFVSLPLLVGMRFDFGPVVPYFYVDVEPAYLTGGHQFAKVTATTNYLNGDSEVKTYNADIDLTDIREQFQIAVGGGVGLEISYGYGAFYLDGSLQFALMEIDKSKDFKSLPMRTSCKAIYFPLTLGIRFFL